VTDSPSRDDSERRLLDLLHTVRYDCLLRSQELLFPEPTDPDTITFSSAENIFGVCRIPAVRLGPLGTTLDKALFTDGGHALLSFSCGDIRLDYDTADLDGDTLDSLAETVRDAYEDAVTLKTHIHRQND